MRAGLVLMSLAVAAASPAAAQARPAAGGAKPAATAAAAGGGVAFVNFQALLQQTPGYAAAESTFTKEMTGFQAEMQKIQGGLETAAQEFEQQSAMLNNAQREAKRKELETRQQEAQRKAQEMEVKAAGRQRELLEPIQKRVAAVIEKLRAEGSYAIVFDVSAPGSNILTADPSADLTARALARLKAAN